VAEHGGNAYPDFGVASYSGSGFSGRPGTPGAAGEIVGQLTALRQT